MITSRPNRRDGPTIPLLAAFLMLAFSMMCAARGFGQAGAQSPGVPQQPRPLPTIPNEPDQPDVNNPPPLTPKQQREILKSKYEKMKQESAQLADLAKSLQQDLDKSSSEVLSLKVLDKADKIEKLAKKIKSEAVQ